ncbi:hypothetical protein [Streptomyces sp. NPDC020983]|uniref:hypothetical protein n=1 Tax=Streptomyces sp. NPDC020983 TaxID=3365106 RepID=UPI0037952EA4
MNDTTDTFEDRLWDALRAEAVRPSADLPADTYRARPPRRAVTPRRVGIGVAAAALVGTSLAVLPGGAGTAYGVEPQRDGLVKFTYDTSAKPTQSKKTVTGLRKQLKAAGIDVFPVPDGETFHAVIMCRTDMAFQRFSSIPDTSNFRGGVLLFGSVSGRDGVAYLRPGKDLVDIEHVYYKGKLVYGVAIFHRDACPQPPKRLHKE